MDYMIFVNVRACLSGAHWQQASKLSALRRFELICKDGDKCAYQYYYYDYDDYYYYYYYYYYNSTTTLLLAWRH